MNIKDILNKFSDIASSPRKQLDFYLSQGKKVVAVAPVYTPEEIIHSMGLIPMGVWGADCPINKAKTYFPAFICSITQTIVESGMNGAYDGVSAIVIPSLCDSLKVLGQNWKYAVPSIPFIPMTYPQNRATNYGSNFTKASYERVINDLKKYTGAVFSDAALAESIRIYNRHNEVIRKLSVTLVKYPSISAVDRSNIFESAFFMVKEDHTTLVEQLLNELQTLPPETSKKTKIIISGILADNATLLSILDENNLQIAGDDIAAQSRQYRTDAPTAETAIESLAAKFCNMNHCSVLYDVQKTRADLIVNMAKEQGARGVVIFLTKFCDPEEFDYVIIKKACEKAKLPIILIEIDRQMTAFEQARTALETFHEMLS